MHGDYGFFRDRKGEKEKTRTVLVMVDRKSSGICAHVVPKKGAGGGFAVKQVHRDIRKFGHRHKITIRSDGEPAIKSLFEKVANMRAQETLLEQSPVGDSRANGRAERAVQTIEKQVRVLKLAVEESYGEISVMHPCFPWLVNHAADVLTKFKVHADGSTSYEKIKRREYTGTMLEFAEKVLYKSSVKVQGGVMQARWMTGIWLGKRFASEEHIIGAGDGTIIRCGAVKPHPDGTLCPDLFNAIRGSPWNPTAKEDQDGEPPAEHQGELPKMPIQRVLPEVPPVRSVIITRQYVDRFGGTPGCSKCHAIALGDESQPTLAHTPACRKRIEAKMAEDPDLKKRLERAE